MRAASPGWSSFACTALSVAVSVPPFKSSMPFGTLTPSESFAPRGT